jgi:hypothetical protein
MSRARLLKWAVVAVVLQLATTILMAQVTTPSKLQPNPKPSLPTQTAVPASPVGRYQIIFNPNVRADTFLLDTQTGQTWIQTQISDAAGAPTIWLFRERIDNDADFVGWSIRHAKSDQK